MKRVGTERLRRLWLFVCWLLVVRGDEIENGLIFAVDSKELHRNHLNPGNWGKFGVK